jgi:hypothetical protein
MKNGKKWIPRTEYDQKPQLLRGQLAAPLEPPLVFKRIDAVDPNEKAIIDFIFNESEKREFEVIQLQQLTVPQRIRMQQLRGILHKQQVNPANLAWPSKAILDETLNSTTQLAVHVRKDVTRRWLRKERGLTHRSNNIVATDTIHVSDQLEDPEPTSNDPDYNPAKRRKTSTLLTVRLSTILNWRYNTGRIRQIILRKF